MRGVKFATANPSGGEAGEVWMSAASINAARRAIVDVLRFLLAQASSLIESLAYE